VCCVLQQLLRCRTLQKVAQRSDKEQC
jgi:hypothetical protein